MCRTSKVTSGESEGGTSHNPWWLWSAPSSTFFHGLFSYKYGGGYPIIWPNRPYRYPIFSLFFHWSAWIRFTIDVMPPCIFVLIRCRLLCRSGSSSLYFLWILFYISCQKVNFIIRHTTFLTYLFCFFFFVIVLNLLVSIITNNCIVPRVSDSYVKTDLPIFL